MAQSSKNQQPKQAVLGKCGPSRWNGSPAFKTWAPLANKRRKDIATSSLVISCSLFTLKKENRSRLPRLIASLARNEAQVYTQCVIDNIHSRLLSVFPIVLFVMVSRHAIHDDNMVELAGWTVSQPVTVLTAAAFKNFPLHCLRTRIHTFEIGQTSSEWSNLRRFWIAKLYGLSHTRCVLISVCVHK